MERKGQKKFNPWQLCCERRDMGKRGACAAPVESSKDAFPASFLVGTGHMENPFLRPCRFSLPFASGEEEAPQARGLGVLHELIEMW